MNTLRAKQEMGSTRCAKCGRAEWDVACAHCEPHHSKGRPRFWSSWSEAERELYEQIETYDRNAEAALERLKEQLTPEQAKELDDLEELLYKARTCIIPMHEARLTRLLPHLADLLYWSGPNGGELRDCSY